MTTSALTVALGVVTLLCLGPATQGFNNECLLSQTLNPPTKGAPQTFLDECAKWVIATTDKVWNTKEDVNGSLKEYFYDGFMSHGSFGSVTIGMQGLKDAVASTQHAFPDLKIHISDCYCVGNDVDGYKSIMPDFLIGTNLGDSSYGKATGKKVKYSGLAITYIQRDQGTWKYIAEWILHDELSLVGQLGLSGTARVPNTTATANEDCGVNLPTWGWKSPNLFSDSKLDTSVKKRDLHTDIAHKVVGGYNKVPLAKSIIKKMDATISGHVECFNWTAWSKVEEPFWMEDMVYDTNWTPLPDVLGNSSGLFEWYSREHVPYNRAFENGFFNQLLFVSEETTATTTTYGSALWQEDLAGIPHTGEPTSIRIFDFYIVNKTAQKIAYNWMLLDLVDLMYRSGSQVLPAAPLPEGWVQPPHAMDGIPAPISELVDPGLYLLSKEVVRKVLDADWLDTDDRSYAGCGSLWMTKNFNFYGPRGIGYASSCVQYYDHFIFPIRSAFANRTFDIDVLTCEGHYCGVHGRMHAIHVGEWLGAKATHQPIKLRFGMHYRIDVQTKMAAESWAIFDLPHFFSQLGINLWDRLETTPRESKAQELHPQS